MANIYFLKINFYKRNVCQLQPQAIYSKSSVKQLMKLYFEILFWNIKMCRDAESHIEKSEDADNACR